MRKNLFLTTAIVTASFVTHAALAESIDQRIEVSQGETRTFNGVTANNINSEGFAGGIIYNEGNVTIDGNSTFSNNTADDGGAIYNEYFGSVNISNSTFNNNTADCYYSFGGAIYSGENSQLTISDSVFSENEAKDSQGYGSGHGGAIANDDGGEITISNTTFSKNKTYGSNGSPNSGGAVYNGKGKINISGSTFELNVATNSAVSTGGAIYVDSYVGEGGNPACIVEISNSSFSKNESSIGGAIGNGGRLDLSNVTFIKNKASFINRNSGGMGGALFNLWLTNIDGGSFQENTAFEGGAIFNRYTATISSTFSDNSAYLGGAIYNEYKMDISDSTFSGNTATEDDSESELSSAQGGAVYNYGKLNITNTTFENNKANALESDSYAGAIYNHKYGQIVISDSEFLGNKATNDESYAYGGAIYNLDKMTISNTNFENNEASTSAMFSYGGSIYNSKNLNITNSTFKNNKANSYSSHGGAVYNKNGQIIISDSTFLGNEAMNGDGYGSGHGGAISNIDDSTITIINTTFTENKTHGTNGSPDAGGAVYNRGGTVKIDGSTFTNNKTIGSVSGMGGAIYNEESYTHEGTMEISNSSFVGNQSSFGGAIGNYGVLELTNATFDGNKALDTYASEEGYGIGGAIFNSSMGKATITDSVFVNNIATSKAGAIENRKDLTFNGNNVFEANTANGQLNDIYNYYGTINVNGSLALDGGIINYSGTINFNDAILKAKLVDVDDNTTKIIASADETHLGTLTGSLSLLLTDDDITKKIVLEGNKNSFSLGNTLYNIEFDDADTYTVTGKKNASQIAQSTGANANQARTIEAIMADTSATGNTTFNGIASEVNNMLQSGNHSQIQSAIEAVTVMAPDVAPRIQQTQTETVNLVFNAIGTRLSNVTSGASQGMSSGDVLQDAAVWMQGLANHAKLNKTSKFNGFKVDTYGVAFGLEKKFDGNIKSGVGYAYSTTDADAKGRDTDVKTHTLFAYGEYKPSNWFMNAIISYGWSDYKENKNVIGNTLKDKYDVKTFGMQAMTGYDVYTQYATITPEVGLRYMHINSDNYVDSAGQKVLSNNSHIITGVIGSKISKTFETTHGLKLTPEAKLAMTYDVKEADNKSTVLLPNGSSYIMNGQNLKRFGIEVGAGLTAEVNDNVEMSLGYEGGFRKDYQNHSVLMNLKYRF